MSFTKKQNSKRLDGLYLIVLCLFCSGTLNHMVRLLGYVPGRLYRSIDVTPDLCYQAGQYIGRINIALKVKSFRSKKGEYVVL